MRCRARLDVDETIAQLGCAHLEILRKWGRIVSEVGSDRTRYEQALWDEFCSKVEF